MNSYLGYKDWRLPNVNELESLVHAGQDDIAAWLNTQGFANVQPQAYWSSSTNAHGTGNAWHVNMMQGGGVNVTGKRYSLYIWPVRAGESKLWKTGQTTCYDETETYYAPKPIPCSGRGQDGALQAGASWPSPRFTNNRNGTVTDSLTRLMWTQHGDAPGPPACSLGKVTTWANALAYVGCLNTYSYLGYTDWRLPNRKELRSVINYGQADSATWLNTQGFLNMQSGGYWSSSTDAYAPDKGLWAWQVSTWDGLKPENKRSLGFVWPVRAGH
jgi:hypothetical protein